MIIIVGFTHSDRANDYSSFMDGWRDGAKQTTHTLTVPDNPAVTGLEWAEAVFVATNIPGGEEYPGVAEVRQAMQPWDHVPDGWRSLSKGDTVTVDGQMYACASSGWEPVTPTVQS